MPKLTSTGQRREMTKDKENEAPTMTRFSRKQNRKVDENDEEEEEELMNLKVKSLKYGSSSSSRVLHSSGSIHSKERNGSSSSNSRDSELNKSKKNARHHDGQQAKGKYQYDQNDENIDFDKRDSANLPDSHGDLQAQFDHLRSLRITEPERLLAEWRKVAEQKSKKSEEYIAILKKQVEKLSHSQMSSIPEKPSSYASERAVKDIHFLQSEIEEMRKREKVLKEENARQARQLDNLRSQTGSSTSSTAYRLGIGSSQMGMGDERAVRRLYEDLTGLMINKVEQVEGRENFRRFHAIFACAGYHDLEIKLEESISDLPSIVPQTSNGPREDLVYTPTLDQDRDAELLQSGRLPEFLKDSIRFERATSIKFMTTLHKRLDRHSKK